MLLDILTGVTTWNTEKVVLHNSIVNFQPVIGSNPLPTIPTIPAINNV
jgi:hypothetical protein